MRKTQKDLIKELNKRIIDLEEIDVHFYDNTYISKHIYFLKGSLFLHKRGDLRQLLSLAYCKKIIRKFINYF